MEEILNNLPTKANHDYVADGTNDFLFVNLDNKNTKYTFSSVVVVGVQCKEKYYLGLDNNDVKYELIKGKVPYDANDRDEIIDMMKKRIFGP